MFTPGVDVVSEAGFGVDPVSGGREIPDAESEHVHRNRPETPGREAGQNGEPVGDGIAAGAPAVHENERFTVTGLPVLRGEPVDGDLLLLNPVGDEFKSHSAHCCTPWHEVKRGGLGPAAGCFVDICGYCSCSVVTTRASSASAPLPCG